MFASYFVVLATAAMSAYAQTVTSSLTMTAYQTLSRCDPTNPDCPLYTPSTTSSAVIETTSSEIITSSSEITTSSTVPNTTTTTGSTLSTFYPTGNSTSHTGPTSYPNATLSYTSKAPSTTPTDLNPTQPSATGEPTEPPSSGAGLASVQSGLLVGVLGLGAVFLA